MCKFAFLYFTNKQTQSLLYTENKNKVSNKKFHNQDITKTFVHAHKITGTCNFEGVVSTGEKSSNIYIFFNYFIFKCASTTDNIKHCKSLEM